MRHRAVLTWSASHFGGALVLSVVSANLEEGAVAVDRCCVQAGDLDKSSRRELELLRAARDGDERALGELCQLCWRPVYRSLGRYTSDPAEVEDMTQEVFLRALRSLPRFEDRGLPFTVYLLRIAANLARDRWRSLPARPVVTADVPEGSALAEAAEEVAVANERRRALVAALDRLSPDHRAVLRMRILEGRSAREVAALMHRNEPAVRQLQVRALAALRLELSKGDGDVRDRS
jgi:RNA polymerase sigma-70 factor, ECF subfamily